MYKVTFSLYQLLIILILFIVYLFDKEITKKRLYLLVARDYFLFHLVDRKQTTF